MKSKKEYKEDFYNDPTNLITLNKLCRSLCKNSKKCYCNSSKLCFYKRLAITMSINKAYKEQR